MGEMPLANMNTGEVTRHLASYLASYLRHLHGAEDQAGGRGTGEGRGGDIRSMAVLSPGRYSPRGCHRLFLQCVDVNDSARPTAMELAMATSPTEWPQLRSDDGDYRYRNVYADEESYL